MLEAMRDAPFEVVAFSSTHVRVDIGADKARARLLRRATILTEAGPVQATLARARMKCVWLCGEDDGKTCHYEAILRTSGLPARPLAVLAGSRVVAGVRTFPASPQQPIGSEERWLAAAPFAPGAETYRWTRFPDGVFMSAFPSGGRDFYAPPMLSPIARNALSSHSRC